MSTAPKAGPVPEVTRAEVEPGGGTPVPGAAAGAGGGVRVVVLVSLNFPDMTESVADLVRRFTRTALEALDAVGADWELIDTSPGCELGDPRGWPA
ncbi:hypothetical protein [Streptomyces sp. NPDC056227]|uniref:hypothetical protein n=1 Tax=Streptomyces sp. NPDC056227 TaxID=3345753 RepID=UPI0035DF9611